MMSGIQTLATLVLGGAFDATELGENDIQPDSKLIEELQQRLVTGTDDVYIQLIDRAEFDRLTSERDALQQRLNAADQRAAVLEVLVGEVLDAVGREPLDLDAVLRLRARMRAALKPAEVGADSCEFCKGWGFRTNPDGADEGCGACNGTGKEPSDDQQ
jgi:hypothetical protein